MVLKGGFALLLYRALRKAAVCPIHPKETEMAQVLLNSRTGVVHKKVKNDDRSECGKVTEIRDGIEKVWAPMDAVSCPICLEICKLPQNVPFTKKNRRKRKRKQ